MGFKVRIWGLKTALSIERLKATLDSAPCTFNPIKTPDNLHEQARGGRYVVVRVQCAPAGHEVLQIRDACKTGKRKTRLIGQTPKSAMVKHQKNLKLLPIAPSTTFEGRGHPDFSRERFTHESGRFWCMIRHHKLNEITFCCHGRHQKAQWSTPHSSNPSASHALLHQVIASVL